MPDLLYICEICGGVLEESHCKALCPNCGRMLDCSDLPILPSNGMVDVDAQGHKVLIPRPSKRLARQAQKNASNSQDS